MEGDRHENIGGEGMGLEISGHQLCRRGRERFEMIVLERVHEIAGESLVKIRGSDAFDGQRKMGAIRARGAGLERKPTAGAKGWGELRQSSGARPAEEIPFPPAPDTAAGKEEI
jgi:hypothetical protein